MVEEASYLACFAASGIPSFAEISHWIMSGWLQISWGLIKVRWSSRTITLNTEVNPPQNSFNKRNIISQKHVHPAVLLPTWKYLTINSKLVLGSGPFPAYLLENKVYPSTAKMATTRWQHQSKPVLTTACGAFGGHENNPHKTPTVCGQKSQYKCKYHKCNTHTYTHFQSMCAVIIFYWALLQQLKLLRCCC